MKIKLLSAFCLLFLATGNLYAGRFGSSAHRGEPAAAKTTLADPGEDNYDIKHLKFNLHVTDTSVYVWGDVSTTAQVMTLSMSSYIFELDTLMVIDSAKINGTLRPVTNVGFVRTMTLPSSLSSGAFFTAQIFYHGVPPAGGGFFNGLTHDVSPGGTQMIYTVSDPWVALDWWPTKQSVTDKIDSVDMYVTVPRGVVDGSNGVLVSVDTSSAPGYSKYHWQTHYPITYYLISIAVARFAEDKHYMHFTGSTDSMLIQNFFIDTATFNPAYKPNFDSIDQIINYYGTIFGRYPFWQEKYGVCYTTLPGGMEHQTMTTIGVPNTYVIAHELCHQWFGDNVSYADWGDVWLSEGFATFSEQLFYTQFWGPAAGRSHRASLLGSALSQPCGELFVTDTTTSTTLFYQPTVYNKGQGVVTMLRYLAPTDSLFFLALQNYQSTYRLSNAKTADMQAIFEGVYGFPLDTFFHEWIYGKGYPIYKITWNQSGSNVFVKLVQTRSCASYDTTFSTALELQLHGATADTIIKIYNNADTQIYAFTWAPTMSTVYLNPDIWTICKSIGLATQDPTLGVGNVMQHKVSILPNPSKNYWEVEQLNENTSLRLTDMSGRVLWQGKSVKGKTVIPASQLPAGDYLLKIGDNNRDSIKLVRW